MLTELPSVIDDRGKLVCMECGKHVPFAIKRVFVLHDLAPGGVRGNHAHRTCHQFLVVVAGALIVELDDGNSRRQHLLADRNRALHIPPMNWIVLREFDANTVCMVLASEPYDPSDYIRNYEEFVSSVNRMVTS